MFRKSLIALASVGMIAAACGMQPAFASAARPAGFSNAHIENDNSFEQIVGVNNTNLSFCNAGGSSCSNYTTVSDGTATFPGNGVQSVVTLQRPNGSCIEVVSTNQVTPLKESNGACPDQAAQDFWITNAGLYVSESASQTDGYLTGMVQDPGTSVVTIEDVGSPRAADEWFTTTS